MKIHEYQAKSLLAERGITVPRSTLATSPEQAAAAFQEPIQEEFEEGIHGEFVARGEVDALGDDRPVLGDEPAGDGTVRATFGQEYESDTFADRVTKVLTLVERDGGWRILAERSEG